MNLPTPKQLSLNVQLNDDATFENFFAPENSTHALALNAVRSLASNNNAERFIYLWGAEGTGTSHLLQAACASASKQNQICLYLPLEELAGYAADALLENLDQVNLVCLDGLQHVVGQIGWAHALFHFYNRLRENKHCRLLVSANCAPRDLMTSLEDLVSRMGWGTTFHLTALSDEEKTQAFKIRAHARGIELSDEVLNFIIQRADRDMLTLFECLHQLDTLSLEEKRRVTIPFIKTALGW
ncbi:MAG: DnaA regulatory inactivator Hda [Pseudomonadales bacterium]